MRSVLALLSLAALGLSLVGGTRSVSGPEWLDDLDAATELARESGRPLLIVFR